jgi:hypothetical protein
MDDLIDNNMIDEPSSAGDSFGYCPQKEAHGQFIRSEKGLNSHYGFRVVSVKNN